MATPARRRRNQTATGPLLIVFVFAALMVFVVFVTAMRWLANNPVIGMLALAAAVAAAAAVISSRRRSAEQRRIYAHQQAEIQAAQSMEISRYHAMGAREFEDAIAYLCHRDGCTDARRVGGAGDLGKDVTAVAPDGRRIVIQCKRYGPTTKVGSQDAQRFGGTCYAVHGAQVAAIVTTSVFTRPAANYAVQQGIRLFDEQALAAWATRTGPAPWH